MAENKTNMINQITVNGITYDISAKFDVNGHELDKSIAIDDNGNVTAGHDLTVDGRLRMSSARCETNDDGVLREAASMDSGNENVFLTGWFNGEYSNSADNQPVRGFWVSLVPNASEKDGGGWRIGDYGKAATLYAYIKDGDGNMRAGYAPLQKYLYRHFVKITATDVVIYANILSHTAIGFNSAEALQLALSNCNALATGKSGSNTVCAIAIDQDNGNLKVYYADGTDNTLNISTLFISDTVGKDLEVDPD